MVDRRLQNEIEHGKFLASHNAGEIWNWETPAGKIRWKRRVDMLTNLLTTGMKVLEIGCGTGYFTKEIIKKPVILTAIDISQELIRVAKRDISESNVEFFVENVCRMSFSDQTFEAVIGSSILHHLDIKLALKEVFRVLKPGGVIAFTEPNMMNPQIALQKNIPVLKKRLGDSPDETAFFSWSLKKELQRAGFTSIEITPFDFLHPRIPRRLIKTLMPIADLAEKIPFVKQFSGSLYIKALK